MMHRPGQGVAHAAINAATVDFLLSPTGQAAAQALQQADLREHQTLSLLTELRRDFSAAEAGALLTLARLRRRAAIKFPQAEALFFTAEALEQATAWPIAYHRATWIATQAPPGVVLDLGCGIGGDTLALAMHRPVIAVDSDPLRLRLAQANAAALGLTQQIEFRLGDWTEWLMAGQLPAAVAAFADPARRVDGRRIFRAEGLQPPLSMLLRLQAALPHVGVKVMPGIQDDEIPAHAGVEFISHAGICKEAVLWFGTLAQQRRWATVETAAGWQHHEADEAEAPPLGPIISGGYLHEPDPAVIRAGGFGVLCRALGGHLFDPQIAYIVAEQAYTHPLVQSFQIWEVHPFQLKLLNQRLQALAIQTVELKKRGMPIEPETLRPRLKLAKQGQAGVVILTRQGDQRLMLIGQRLGNT
ncbi:MAG: class I SAM-dependent methyltransferase [Caldilineaceae bacterium]